MTARDLLQRRTTDEHGNTRWEATPLVSAALTGKLVVLDGIQRLRNDTLGVVYQLLFDRELQLFDGTRLVSPQRYVARCARGSGACLGYSAAVVADRHAFSRGHGRARLSVGMRRCRSSCPLRKWRPLRSSVCTRASGFWPLLRPRRRRTRG